MKLSNIIFLGLVSLMAGVAFGLAIKNEHNYDSVIRANGRPGKFEFLRVLEKGSANVKGMPSQLPICEYKVTDSENGSVQLIPGECQFLENKVPFHSYYIPQDSDHKLLRINSLWIRPIVLIPGIIFSFLTILLVLFIISYRKHRS